MNGTYRRQASAERIVPPSLPGIILAILLLLPTGSGVLAEEQPEDQPLVRVNGETISSLDLESELREAASNGVVQLPSSDAILRRMIENRLLEQEGYRIGADQYPEVAGQVRGARRLKGISALLDSVAATIEPIPEEELDAQLTRVQLIRRASHILVDDEDQAQALADSLDAGAEFRGLAIRHSKDRTTAVQGGDLGWKAEGAYAPEFEAALGELAPGEHSGPVHTEFGWHLILLVDQREERAGQNEAMIAALKDEFQKQNRTNGIHRYVRGLWSKYGVEVDRELLKSMDFVEADVETVRGYGDRNDVLVHTSRADLTMQQLYRNILYKYFHGITGKPEANAIRDQMLEEWVDEAVLSYEAIERGMTHSERVNEFVGVMERRLVREQVVNGIGRAKAKATEDEVRQFYQDNRHLFSAPSRMKIQSAVLVDEAAATSFREGLESGSDFLWLAKRASGIREMNPKDLSGWMDAARLGLDEQLRSEGELLGPVLVEGEWLVGKVLEFEPGEPRPFEECEGQVRSILERRRLGEAMKETLDRLEAEADIEILDDAERYVAAWLKEYEKRAAVEQRSGGMPSHGGL